MADFWVVATGINVGATLQLLLNGTYPMSYVGANPMPVESAFMDPAQPGQILVLPIGTAYTVTITAQPAGETCTLGHASGTAKFVNTIEANCVATAAGANGFAHASGVTAPTIDAGAALGEYPGAAVAVDATGRIWSFGGEVDDPSFGSGLTNRLSVSAERTVAWARVSGADGINAPGHYGTRAEPSPANVPGARTDARLWVDAQGEVWLCGGQGVGADGTHGALSDVWRFDPGTQAWTWEGGSDRATSDTR